MNLFFDDFRQNTRGRRIVADVVEKNSLLDGLVQHAVNVLDGLCGERSSIRFCGAARNLSLFTFASVSTIPRGACALPSAMAAVNTRPLNSAAAADKTEAVAGVL